MTLELECTNSIFSLKNKESILVYPILGKFYEGIHFSKLNLLSDKNDFSCHVYFFGFSGANEDSIKETYFIDSVAIDKVVAGRERMNKISSENLKIIPNKNLLTFTRSDLSDICSGRETIFLKSMYNSGNFLYRYFDSAKHLVRGVFLDKIRCPDLISRLKLL